MRTTITLVFAFGFVMMGQAQKTGAPFTGKPQVIPGRIQCEYFNLGGEGIGYHDNDSINSGSGKLNPADGSFLNEFRMREGVDISYTKARDIDNTPFNKVVPEMEQLYVGWTEEGEWTKYNVLVLKPGVYTVHLMYTANGDGEISLAMDGKEFIRGLVPSTNDAADTVAWRQWHHWNKVRIRGEFFLRMGEHVLTLRTTGHGNMNYDCLEFVRYPTQ